MKKLYYLLFLTLTLTTYSFAQPPQGFPYQAVARYNNGNLIANKNIALRFSILDGSNVGITVYQETQTATTNSLGLFNLNIGQGTIVSGTFSAINWASGAKFIKVELDTSGGSTFTLMGITQLMSVPYALQAGSNIRSTGPVIDPGHPTTNSWTQKANAGNIVRSMGVGFSIGQLGYMGTGATMNGFTALDDFWEYNVGNNTWTQKANFPGGGRKGAVGFSIGNKGYVGTGETVNALGGYVNYDLWEYAPAQNIWTQKTNLTGSARKLATGFSIGNKGYIGLGTDGGSDLIDFWEYDPATDLWAQKANYNGNGKRFVASFTVGSKGYIGLGTDVNGNYYNDMNEYNPATNSWISKTSFPSAGRHSTAGFAMNNKGYIGTGYDGSSYLNDFWEYNPANDTWTTKATYTGSARKNAIGFSIGNKGYIGTGSDILERNDIWEYMDGNVSGTAYSSAANVDSNNSVTDGAWTLYNNQVYNSNSGNVGVGTSTPANKFSVVGNADFDGNVGIGTSNPNAQLHTTGKVKFEDLSGVGLRPVFADVSGNLNTFKNVVTGSNNNIQNIPDNSCAGISSSIILAGLPVVLASSNIAVTLNITHSYDSDLIVDLQTPDGSIINLIYHNGSSGDNFTNTVLNDNTAAVLPTNTPIGQPFSGTFKPAGNMMTTCNISPTVSTFGAIGGGIINPNGTWILKVFDDDALSVGTLNSWSVNISNIQMGSNNYLPKWNNNTLTSTSLIYDNGTNIGVGTTNPQGGFHLKTLGNNYGFIQQTDSAFLGTFMSGRDVYLLGGSGGNLHLSSNGTVQLSLLNNGNIGIGTTSPNGSLQIKNNPINRKFVLHEDANNDHQYYGLGINSAAMRYQVGSTGASHIFYAGSGVSSSNELMRIRGDGDVGIGTSNPYAKLSLQVTPGAADGISITDGVMKVNLMTANGSGYVGTATNHPFRIFSGTGLNASLFLNPVGQVGVQTSNPTATLSVNGSADKPGGGSWAVFSDRRLKKNISNFNDGLNELLKIDPVKYHYNEILECDTSIEYIGVIAQELQEIAPYMTKSVKIKDTDYLEVDNSAMTYMLINAMKEINSKCETLNTKYEEQKKQNEFLQNQLNELKELIKK